MPLSLWMVVPPCLTVKPHPNWSLVNEPTVYTIYEVLRFCCFLEWEAWFLTPFCPRAILGSAFSRFLAGVSRRDAGISLLTFPTHWFAWVLSAGIFAVLSPLLDPSKTCPIQVCTPLCLSRLYGVGLWRAQDCEEYEQCAGLWRVFRTVKSSKDCEEREESAELLKPVLNWANVCSPEHTSDTSTNYDSFLNWTFSSPNMVRTVQTLLHSQLACNKMQASARTCSRRAADSMIENVG